ncbi:hypothetical protein U1Q18_049809, partial [Sarracenia purpurea var. burkii]
MMMDRGNGDDEIHVLAVDNNLIDRKLIEKLFKNSSIEKMMMTAIEVSELVNDCGEDSGAIAVAVAVVVKGNNQINEGEEEEKTVV